MDVDRHLLARWRLVLGKSAEKCAITCQGHAACERIENLVGFLFGPQDHAAGGKPASRQGGTGGSVLTIPEWVDQVAEFFPHQAKEVLERELVRRRGIAELPALKTSLILFDTSVVDLSGQVGQPVDVLLSIQLGGGTDITQALQYAQQLVREPLRTIVVLITDFYEGRDERDLVRQVKRMAETGIRLIGLGALGYDARPAYNKPAAAKLRKVGMDILVCTPEKLAECMAQIIRG